MKGEFLINQNGNCIPDYSILPPLRKTLGITINEFLSGEKLTNDNYQQKLEENLILNMPELKKKTKNSFIYYQNSLINIAYLPRFKHLRIYKSPL